MFWFLCNTKTTPRHRRRRPEQPRCRCRCCCRPADSPAAALTVAYLFRQDNRPEALARGLGSPDAGVRPIRRMQGAAEGESQDSAFLRRALLEAGIGAASPCPGFQVQPSTTTAVPVVPVVPPQGATDHPATSTSSQQLPVPQTTHPQGLGGIASSFSSWPSLWCSRQRSV